MRIITFAHICATYFIKRNTKWLWALYPWLLLCSIIIIVAFEGLYEKIEEAKRKGLT